MSSERAELIAPPHWRAIDLISDLHLQASEPETFSAWTNYLKTTRADALFILGDLFEVWVGDDVAAPLAATSDCFEAQCSSHLHQAAQRLDIFFMHGNRDFLVGQDFLNQCGTGLLDDPTVLFFGEQRWLLSHGDALCLADAEYQQFRKMVRSAAWQTDFLSKPLPERQAIARGLRAQSEARKKLGLKFIDVDAEMATQWLRDSGANTLIHGHTHQPADHDMGQGLQRIVMSDWDVAAKPPRAQVLRLSLRDSQNGKASPTLKRYYINSNLSILFES
jgi:UDP-2,3-diacylglucosamine hydrolase